MYAIKVVQAVELRSSACIEGCCRKSNWTSRGSTDKWKKKKTKTKTNVCLGCKEEIGIINQFSLFCSTLSDESDTFKTIDR